MLKQGLTSLVHVNYGTKAIACVFYGTVKIWCDISQPRFVGHMPNEQVVFDWAVNAWHENRPPSLFKDVVDGAVWTIHGAPGFTMTADGQLYNTAKIPLHLSLSNVFIRVTNPSGLYADTNRFTIKSYVDAKHWKIVVNSAVNDPYINVATVEAFIGNAKQTITYDDSGSTKVYDNDNPGYRFSSAIDQMANTIWHSNVNEHNFAAKFHFSRVIRLNRITVQPRQGGTGNNFTNRAPKDFHLDAWVNNRYITVATWHKTNWNGNFESFTVQ